MLLYNKSLDPTHAIFRHLTLILNLDVRHIEIERLRIYDFLLSNPYHIFKMKVKREFLKEKNQFKKFKNIYNNFDSYSLFQNMKPIQNVATSHLEKMSIMKHSKINSVYELNINNIGGLLSESINEEVNESIQFTLNFIKNILNHMELLGPKGLKASSRLLEYRYDKI
jgi:hypothetical protein